MSCFCIVLSGEVVLILYFTLSIEFGVVPYFSFLCGEYLLSLTFHWIQCSSLSTLLILLLFALAVLFLKCGNLNWHRFVPTFLFSLTFYRINRKIKLLFCHSDLLTANRTCKSYNRPLFLLLNDL